MHGAKTAGSTEKSRQELNDVAGVLRIAVMALGLVGQRDNYRLAEGIRRIGATHQAYVPARTFAAAKTCSFFSAQSRGAREELRAGWIGRRRIGKRGKAPHHPLSGGNVTRTS